MVHTEGPKHTRKSIKKGKVPTSSLLFLSSIFSFPSPLPGPAPPRQVGSAHAQRLRAAKVQLLRLQPHPGQDEPGPPGLQGKIERRAAGLQGSAGADPTRIKYRGCVKNGRMEGRFPVTFRSQFDVTPFTTI